MAFDFDINNFLSTRIDAPLPTERPKVPTGRWLVRIGEIDSGAGIESWVKAPSGNATSPKLGVPLLVVDDAVLRQMGRTSSNPPRVPYDIWLDNLDKNDALGLLFSVAGVDPTGKALTASLGELPGKGPFYATFAEDKKNPQYMRITKLEKA